jgi:hypothetical protein
MGLNGTDKTEKQHGQTSTNMDHGQGPWHGKT